MIAQNTIPFDEIKLPNILYKYRDWRNLEHKRILTKKEIFFSSPSGLGDHYECLPIKYELNNQSAYDFYYNTAHVKINGCFSPECRHGIATQMIKEYDSNKYKFEEEANKKLRETLDSQLSIFCASDTYENTRLWNDFGAEDYGFCIGFNMKKLFLKNELFGCGGKVRYREEKIIVKNRIPTNECERVEDMIEMIYSLPKIHEKEEEYRLSKFNIVDRKIEISSEAIEEVILGRHMSNNDKDEIISILKTDFPNIKIIERC
jgi:hypothetical protein